MERSVGSFVGACGEDDEADSIGEFDAVDLPVFVSEQTHTTDGCGELDFITNLVRIPGIFGFIFFVGVVVSEAFVGNLLIEAAHLVCFCIELLHVIQGALGVSGHIRDDGTSGVIIPEGDGQRLPGMIFFDGEKARGALIECFGLAEEVRAEPGWTNVCGSQGFSMLERIDNNIKGTRDINVVGVVGNFSGEE